MNLWHKVRRLLGVHDALLVAAFLTANTVTDVVLNMLATPTHQAFWLVGLVTATVMLAVRQAYQAPESTRTVLSASDFGVRADSRLTDRKAAVVVLGLDSDQPHAALARLLCEAESLEYLALVGTHETRDQRVAEHVRTRLFAVCDRTIAPERFRTFEHNHAMSVGDFAESVSEALAWLARCGVDMRDVIVDVSAGRRMAGFGALQAADAMSVETQYLAYRWDHATHRPVKHQPSFRVVSSYTDASSDRQVELDLPSAHESPATLACELAGDLDLADQPSHSMCPIWSHRLPLTTS
jgi:hypothetical protein